ncbi:MAG: outer membrane lipoprotein chaperone LolA [Oligoflexia bacterium]|nr:outer membrane lipoprotein chaperone LolA [Oligoflexia bacterium]
MITLALLLALIVPDPGRQVWAKSDSLPVILREIEAKYGEAGTFSARFSQINESATLKTRKTSSGTLLVKRPDKVRWETLAPDRNLLVSDGRKFWFYTPPFDEGENGQVVEKKSSAVKSKLAQALLSGSFSAARDLKVKKAGDREFVLVPKAGTAGSVKEARVFVNPAEKLIQKVILLHRDGNRSEITLSEIELGKPLEDRLFTFQIPPNTDRLKE